MTSYWQLLKEGIAQDRRATSHSVRLHVETNHPEFSRTTFEKVLQFAIEVGRVQKEGKILCLTAKQKVSSSERAPSSAQKAQEQQENKQENGTEEDAPARVRRTRPVPKRSSSVATAKKRRGSGLRRK